MGRDLFGEVPLILDDAADGQPPPGQPRDLDRRVRALVRVDPTEGDQSGAGVGGEGQLGDVDAVVHGGDVLQIGRPVGVGDGHVVRRRSGICGQDPGAREAVDRGEQRGAALPGEGQRQPVQMTVYQVELDGPGERVGDVHRLPYPPVHRRVLGIAVRAHAVEACRGDRVEGGEQCHVDAACDQPFGE